jgi:hypothetical protein
VQEAQPLAKEVQELVVLRMMMLLQLEVRALKAVQSRAQEPLVLLLKLALQVKTKMTTVRVELPPQVLPPQVRSTAKYPRQMLVLRATPQSVLPLAPQNQTQDLALVQTPITMAKLAPLHPSEIPSSSLLPTSARPLKPQTVKQQPSLSLNLDPAQREQPYTSLPRPLAIPGLLLSRRQFQRHSLKQQLLAGTMMY